MYDVPWAGLIVGISAGVAVIVSLTGISGSTHKPSELHKLFLGLPNWDFSTSWASNFTAAGAILGTVLAADILSDTRLMSSNSYAGLSLFFGGLVLIAPFIFAATSRKDLTEQTANESSVVYDGNAWFFLVSSAVTLWAVIGELWLLMLLSWEFLHGPVATSCIIFLCVVGALALRYGRYSISAVLQFQALERGAPQDRVEEIIEGVQPVTRQSAPVGTKPRWNVL